MKYELIDLVNKGSHSRKVLDPSLIVKDGDNLKYLPGNILDANTVDGMVSDVDAKADGIQDDLDSYKASIGTNTDQTHTLVERVSGIEDLIIDIINSHIQSDDVKQVVVLT